MLVAAGHWGYSKRDKNYGVKIVDENGVTWTLGNQVGKNSTQMTSGLNYEVTECSHRGNAKHLQDYEATCSWDIDGVATWWIDNKETFWSSDCKKQ
tara:strand:+ start:378 stop:665 length:288 start_codon:yes stop_codon:yes gene_type:complete